MTHLAPAESPSGSTPRPARSWWPVAGFAAVLVLATAFAGIARWAQADAREFATRARQEFAGDDVDALLALLQSERHSLRDRNHALYALGRIGDPRALPALERLHTGEPCQHERFICQRELEKAIARCRGRNRAPRWLPLVPR